MDYNPPFVTKIQMLLDVGLVDIRTVPVHLTSYCFRAFWTYGCPKRIGLTQPKIGFKVEVNDAVQIPDW